MRTLFSVVTALFILASTSISAVELGGIVMPDEIQAGEQRLALNGAGIRSKFVFDLYVAGLYLVDKNQDANAIIASKDATALRLHIISSKITSKKMTKATRKGFEKATGGNVEAIATEIDLFLQTFSDKIVEGDVFEFVYQPEQGVAVAKNGHQQAVISSFEFKRALFGIWLSDKPVKERLKKNLLGQ